ncbi:PLC-like phosphodiesterase [Jimgerdemannia flammicorona]|uniref:PLC-like phosphodiesterase n=1 Tax=Jimgerdemannia flammicorona TaxID=994334 RepID=A0A433QM84_9FUNG|nr:PLC-like phosphodiesterase [Jimgerdemannia flammicorona]
MRTPLLFLTTAALAAVASAQCNGDSSLCTKKFSEVAYVTTHNAYASTSNTAANQHYDIVQQLTDGVRGFMLDAHKPSSGTSNDIELCHESCSILDAGPLVATLTKMKSWLDANPGEVITIFWENFDNFTPAQFQSSYTSSGISSMVWTQTVGQAWPTLQSMIDANQRVVNFVDTGANYTVAPWLHAEYDFVFETPFSVLNESGFVCTVDRPKNPANQNSMMYVMNHFLYGSLSIAGIEIELPQPGKVNTTNSDASLGLQERTCTSTFGRIPNYIAVDFYEAGDVFQLLASMNGVTYVEKQLGGTKTTSSSNSQATTGNKISITIGNGGIGGSDAGRWAAMLTAVVGGVAAWVIVM